MQDTTTAPYPTHSAERPTVQELDAAWPKVKERVDFTRELTLDAAWRHADHPTDSTLRELQAAVQENQAADAAAAEWHHDMAAALRRERAWTPQEDRRATWEAA